MGGSDRLRAVHARQLGALGQGGDPYDYRDAIPAMARYLLDHDVLHDIPNAVYAYNHSWEYVALVLGPHELLRGIAGIRRSAGCSSGGPQ